MLPCTWEDGNLRWMKAVEMMIPVPKCLATKNKLAQKPALRPKAIGSPLDTLSPLD